MWQLQIQNHRLSFFYSALVVYALLGFCWGSLNLLSPSGVGVVAPGLWVGAGVLALASKLYSWWQWQRGNHESILRFQPALLVAGLLLVILSDVVERAFGFYTDAGVRSMVWCLGVPVTAMLYWRWRSSDRGDGLQRLFSWPLLIFFQLLVAVLFLQYADGRMIFSDDHPSFLYRFHLLQQHFPSIPFYNPAWEAGYSAREFFASGVLNIFFLTLPVWYLGIDLADIQQISMYNFVVLYLAVVVVPFANYFAACLLRVERSVAILAALLSLGPSLGFFEWLLKYGTLGFCCSMGLIPLGIALCYRFAISEELPRLWHLVALLLVSYLCIAWTLAVFAFVPVALVALVQYRATFAPGRKALVCAFAALFLLCNGPWIHVFLEESKVLSFVGKSTLPGAEQEAGPTGQQPAKKATRKGVAHERTLAGQVQLARSFFAKINPLLLLFVFPGIVLLRDRSLRLVWSLTMGFLLVVAIWGDLLKPQLELRRMIIPASFLACLPAALALFSFLQHVAGVLVGARRAPTMREKAVSALLLTFVLGAVLMSPVTVAAVFQNRSDEQFVFAPEELEPLAGAIQQHGGDGRTFFLGFILHELGATHHSVQDGGHIAPLAAFTGKPLYAFFYYHSRWMTIDPIPVSYRERGEDGIEEFLDLLNVTAVVTFKREWARYCVNSWRYKQVFHQGRFRVFTRRAPTDGYFYRGDGEVRQLSNGFEVTPQSNEVVVKFRYLPKLKAHLPQHVELFAEPVFKEEVGSSVQEQVSFVGLRVHPELIGKPIRIGYRPN